eukprot:CAMPEP_0184504988 /NCGR_PEP_ID=MMETSP0113_2-20130426/52751_1 /TAXON_ID=91329 /ORGANISM="Norrisiella sphaerica, Strain BC52" /LENGTH=516 /DNA_ID=CAMNT_0026894653 /DNA_START=168 /DNA_END=1715 /DNA_ORIENTATION=+
MGAVSTLGLALALSVLLAGWAGNPENPGNAGSFDPAQPSQLRTPVSKPRTPDIRVSIGDARRIPGVGRGRGYTSRDARSFSEPASRHLGIPGIYISTTRLNQHRSSSRPPRRGESSRQARWYSTGGGWSSPCSAISDCNLDICTDSSSPFTTYSSLVPHSLPLTYRPHYPHPISLRHTLGALRGRRHVSVFCAAEARASCQFLEGGGLVRKSLNLSFESSSGVSHGAPVHRNEETLQPTGEDAETTKENGKNDKAMTPTPTPSLSLSLPLPPRFLHPRRGEGCGGERRDTSSPVTDESGGSEESDMAGALKSRSPEAFQARERLLKAADDEQLHVAMNAYFDFVYACEKSGIEPSLYVYNRLLGLCAKQKNWAQALSLLQEMKLRNTEPGLVALSSTAAALSRAGRVEEGEELILQIATPEMTRRLGTTARAITPILAGYSARGDWEKSLSLLRRMEKAGVQPSTISFDSVLLGMCNANAYDAGVRLLDDMERRNRAEMPGNFTGACMCDTMSGVG